MKSGGIIFVGPIRVLGNSVILIPGASMACRIQQDSGTVLQSCEWKCFHSKRTIVELASTDSLRRILIENASSARPDMSRHVSIGD